VLTAFRQWLDAEERVVVPRSPIADAIGYARNQWSALTRFLEDGRLPLDNNVSERELRREVTGRRNWTFVGSDDGAEWNAVAVSRIASCALHQLEPWAYLRDVLTVLPQWPASRVLELAPKFWHQTRQHLDAEQLAGRKPV
jgi:transposase